MKKVMLIVIGLVFILTSCTRKVEEKQDFKLEKQIENIEINKTKVFGTMKKIDDKMLKDIFEISAENIESYAIGIPEDDENGALYIIIKPKENYVDRVRNGIHKYIKSRIANQFDYVNNMEGLYEEYNGYQIQILTKHNEEVIKQIKKYIK